MKRIISLLLFVLIVVCNVALADDVYEKPILFRGIEWASSYTDALKGLPEGIRMYDLDEDEYWYPVIEYMFDPFNTLYRAEIGASTYAMSSSLSNVKVAGYPVEGLKLYFTFLPGDDGLLIKDADHTALFYAYYRLEPKDPDAVYDDLVTKLTSIYGDVDATEKKSPYISYEMALWNGADGTMVSVMREDYPSGTHNIYIKYGFSGGNDLMEAAYNAIVLEETQSAASNIDGL